MLEFAINKKRELQLVQRDVSPTVYLDHWALRKLSEDPARATRFSAALESRNGTLALSWLNLIEFAKVKRENQARTAETLIEAHLPRVFFIDVDPFAVIKRENELLAGRAPAPPHADLDLLAVFNELKPTSFNFFTARDLFAIVQDSRFAGRCADFANAMMRSLEALRNGSASGSRLRSRRGRLPSDPQIQRGTRFIWSELVRALVADKRTKITQNQAIDLIHAVVPVAYCDFVLLDKHWRTQVDGVRARFKEVGLGVPIARVFSEQKKGVDRFLSELELI